MKTRLNYFVIFVVLWVVFLLITPDLSIEIYAFEAWFLEVLQDPETITHYTCIAGAIVVVGIVYIFFRLKNEK